MDDVLNIVKDCEPFIRHTGTPSLNNDIKCAEAIKCKNPTPGWLHWPHFDNQGEGAPDPPVVGQRVVR
jgi:hypothetical protein